MSIVMYDSSVNSLVSIIIVNYNAGPHLARCLDSLAGTGLRQDIIVVDNASADDSLAGITGQAGIRLVRNDSNRGFAVACNQGIAEANGDFLLFLNPDCVLQPDALRRMLEALESSRTAGMAGGLLLNPDGSEQGGGRRATPTPWRALVRAFGLYRLEQFWPGLFPDFHLHKQPLPDEPVRVDAISGACMLVKRSALAEVGPWDEGYFLHCEDLDWCMRFQQKGLDILFVPDAPIQHAKGVCSMPRPYFVAWHKHCGMVRYYLRFFSDSYPGPLMALVVAGVWFRFCLEILYASALGAVRRFRHA